MNYLQLNGLLTVTNDEFAIVKLTEKSREFMQSGGTLTMKMAKEQEKPQKDKKEKAGSCLLYTSDCLLWRRAGKLRV